MDYIISLINKEKLKYQQGLIFTRETKSGKFTLPTLMMAGGIGGYGGGCDGGSE